MQSSAMRKLRGIPGSPSVDLLHAVRCAIGQELNFDSVTIGDRFTYMAQKSDSQFRVAPTDNYLPIVCAVTFASSIYSCLQTRSWTGRWMDERGLSASCTSQRTYVP